MEQDSGIELPYPAWKAGIITVILILHYIGSGYSLLQFGTRVTISLAVSNSALSDLLIDACNPPCVPQGGVEPPEFWF